MQAYANADFGSGRQIRAGLACGQLPAARARSVIERSPASCPLSTTSPRFASGAESSANASTAFSSSCEQCDRVERDHCVPHGSRLPLRAAPPQARRGELDEPHRVGTRCDEATFVQHAIVQSASTVTGCGPSSRNAAQSAERLPVATLRASAFAPVRTTCRRPRGSEQGLRRVRRRTASSRMRWRWPRQSDRTSRGDRKRTALAISAEGKERSPMTRPTTRSWTHARRSGTHRSSWPQRRSRNGPACLTVGEGEPPRSPSPAQSARSPGCAAAQASGHRSRSFTWWSVTTSPPTHVRPRVPSARAVRSSRGTPSCGPARSCP